MNYIRRMIRSIKMMDKSLFFLTLILSLFGLFMIFSSSYVKASVEEGNALKYLFKQGFIIIAGFTLYFIVINYSLSNYKRNIKFFLSLIIGLLFFVLIFGNPINDAKSWIELPFFNLQPSEIIKIVLLIYMGVYYSTFKYNTDNYVIMLTPIFIGVVIIGLVALQPDLGTALIIFFIMTFTFFTIPIKKEYKKKIYKSLIFMGTALVLGLTLIYFLKGNILNKRLQQRLNYGNPCESYNEVGPGYQVCNGFIAINSSSIFGKGIGNSTQKYLYLPEAHTDYIFPIIIEELGLLVGILIIISYAYLVYKILIIAKSSNNLMGGIIGYGVAIYICSHIFINLGGVLNVIPLTGVPLPFLSYGGSFTLNLLISIGFVQRIAIENNIFMKEEAIRNKIREK